MFGSMQQEEGYQFRRAPSLTRREMSSGARVFANPCLRTGGFACTVLLIMSIDVKELSKVKAEAVAEAKSATTAEDLEAVRVRYLGRKGLLPKIMKGLKDADPSERPILGQLANELKQELMAAIADHSGSSAERSSGAFDYTLPGQWRALGSRHPVSMLIEESARIFGALGFTVG